MIGGKRIFGKRICERVMEINTAIEKEDNMSLVIQVNTQNRVNSNTILSDHSTDKVEKTQGKNVGKTIFAGDLNLGEDPIAKKRKEAQEKALKIVQSAWAGDQAVEQSIQDRKDNYDKTKLLKEETLEVLKDIKANKAALKESYGVADDSQEQKDLELLEKYQENMSGLSTEGLTEEEQKRLSEIMKEPMTEYQNMALELNKQEIKFKKDIDKADRQMQNDIRSIRDIKLESLKSDPMVKAQKEADSVIKAASDEIIGMLKEEATNHLDEELEEKKEKAEEAAEKKEEKEEQLEELQEKRAIQKALIEGTKEAVEKAKTEQRQNDMQDVSLTDAMELTNTNGKMEDVQKMLDDLKNSMNLLEADLKGIQIDEEV